MNNISTFKNFRRATDDHVVHQKKSPVSEASDSIIPTVVIEIQERIQILREMIRNFQEEIAELRLKNEELRSRNTALQLKNDSLEGIRAIPD